MPMLARMLLCVACRSAAGSGFADGVVNASAMRASVASHTVCVLPHALPRACRRKNDADMHYQALQAEYSEGLLARQARLSRECTRFACAFANPLACPLAAAASSVACTHSHQHTHAPATLSRSPAGAAAHERRAARLAAALDGRHPAAADARRPQPLSRARTHPARRDAVCRRHALLQVRRLCCILCCILSQERLLLLRRWLHSFSTCVLCGVPRVCRCQHLLHATRAHANSRATRDHPQGARGGARGQRVRLPAGALTQRHAGAARADRLCGSGAAAPDGGHLGPHVI